MTDPKATPETTLLSKLEAFSGQHRDLTAELENPQIAGQPARMIEISKTLARLARLVEPYRRWQELDRQLSETRTMAVDPSQDAEMRALARSEADDLQIRRDALLEEIKDRIVSSREA